MRFVSPQAAQGPDAAPDPEFAVPDVQTLLERVRGWIEAPVTFRDDALEFALSFGPKLIGAIIVVVAGAWIARRLRDLLETSLRGARLDVMLASFLANMAYFGALAFVAISALGTLGIPTTNFAVVIASVGFAIGFALQGSLGNLAAGVMILIFKPFRVGDYIEGAGHAGTVQSVGTFMTILCTPDNKRIVLPNGALTSSSIVNYSANPTRRIDLLFGISGEEDIDQARAAIEGALSSDSRVLREPAPSVVVTELAEGSLKLGVAAWAASRDYGDVRAMLLERVKKALDAQGIRMAYAQRYVYVQRAAPAGAQASKRTQ